MYSVAFVDEYNPPNFVEEAGWTYSWAYANGLLASAIYMGMWCLWRFESKPFY